MTGLRLDVWRATTDNDDGAAWQADTRYGMLWRELGLHRMQHRLDAVELGADALTVRTRVAPAAREVGLRHDLPLDLRRHPAEADRVGGPGGRLDACRCRGSASGSGSRRRTT